MVLKTIAIHIRRSAVLLAITLPWWTPGLAIAQTNYTFTTVAKAGDTSGGVTFSSYFQPGAITNAGEVTFAPAVTPAGESIFLWRNGQSLKIIAAGEPLPGGGVFGYALAPTNLNNRSEVAFISVPLGLPLPIGLGSGIYRASANSIIESLVIPGVTKTAEGSVIYGSSFSAQINDRGQ